MPRQNVALAQFNRGIVSALAFARTDLKRIAFSAETMTNWMARVFGSMMLRPGLGYIGSSASDAAANFLPFIFATGDTAALEITDSNLRVWVSDALVTRPSVSTTVTNGTFDANLTSWTNADEAGGTSAWVAGGYMGLTGNGTAAAIRRQTLGVGAADQNVEHGIRIIINRGPVVFRAGSTSGDDDYVTETSLGTGTHSIAITPTGASIFLEFQSRLKRQVLVDSVAVEGAGVMSVTAPWSAANLGKLRSDQSGSIVFIACDGYQQRKIERRGSRSWSVVTYAPEDGPFRDINTGPITLTASALTGNVTLTASASLFHSTHVGALFRVASIGQSVTTAVSAENNFSASIRVTGVGAARVWQLILTGVWVANVEIQQSLDNSTWVDYSVNTANGTFAQNDGLDNQIVYYRAGVKTGGYTSGTVNITLTFPGGSIVGVARVTGFTSKTVVSAEVIKDLGGTTATPNWYEGAWSDFRGWPTSVQFAEGRLWWAGRNGIDGSVSDAFDTFDDQTVGDSGPISRTVGSGPVDTINWVLSLQQLLLGAEGAEFACRSSSIDSPLTPTDFMIKAASTQGSAAVEAERIDQAGVYVQRGGTRLMDISSQQYYGQYASNDLSILAPEVTQPQIVRMAVQRQPDTRIHCVLSDGTVAILVFDRAEQVTCWLKVTTDGTVEDVLVLPGVAGQSEDVVYYHVNRTINGSTKRYLEKWALESACAGGTNNNQADCYVTYSGAPTLTITGLSHLEGKAVVVWADGADLSPDDSSGNQTTYTVTGGQITLSTMVSNAVIGLPYTAQWKSTKLAYGSVSGTALAQKKIIDHLGVILKDTHAFGLKYGSSFSATDLQDLPQIEDGTTVSSNAVRTNYDEEAFEFPGTWDSDARLCLQAKAPRPCKLLAAVISVQTNEKG